MQKTKSVLILLAAFAVTGCAPDATSPAGARRAGAAMASNVMEQPAPLYSVPPQSRVPNSYIVMFNPGVGEAESRAATDRFVARHQLRPSRRWHHPRGIRGFASELSAAALDDIRHDPSVSFVQENGRGTLAGEAIRFGAAWNVDVIDQRSLTPDSYYTYSDNTFAVLHVIDSGMRLTHQEFAGMAFFSLGSDYTGEGRIDDCRGHGTEVAATAAGYSVGVAPTHFGGVTFWSHQVADCYGANEDSWTIAALNDILERDYNDGVDPAYKSVINMSLEWDSPRPAIDAAIRASSNYGYIIVIAAGNSDADVCTRTPGTVRDAAIIVGSIEQHGYRALGSNWGSCVDIWAPGVSIVTASHLTDSDYTITAGTSVAAPHVTGVALQYISKHPEAQFSQARAAIVGNATYGLLNTGPLEAGGIGPGSPNLMLYSRFHPF